MKRKPRDRTIYFPWERPGPLAKRFGISRTRPIVAALALIGLFVILGIRERRKVGVRLTRATIGVVAKGVDRYRADHDGRCPTELGELKSGGYIAFDPVDAWGRPLRLLCPGFSNRSRYDLMSDGPDFQFGGLDRVE